MKKRVRVNPKTQKPLSRIMNFEEVTSTYTLEEAMEEANRCLECKNAPCVSGCPVSVNIPEFIKAIKKGNIETAKRIIALSNYLPSICGRVCPQENHCEGRCILSKSSRAISIGKLERFVGDYNPNQTEKANEKPMLNGIKVAVVGSGPAGLSCAGFLTDIGIEVTVYEALHKLGGVLTYGIPPFRLPKADVVDKEINGLAVRGVKFVRNFIIGKTKTLQALAKDEGYNAVFIGTGAGTPIFLNIPGENALGVYSANEILTRINLMQAHNNEYQTPLDIGKKVAIIGGGNVAFDVARSVVRPGAEAHILYRRDKESLPARVEEIHHGVEEGVILHELVSPMEIRSDEEGQVIGLMLRKMKLEERDSSGRRRPVPVENESIYMTFDTVIVSIGTKPNRLVLEGNEIELTEYGCIETKVETGETSVEMVFAGGDVATGSATVIEAMEAGKRAGMSIAKKLIN